MNIDRWFLRLSFKDIILFKNILNQINEERKYIVYLNEATGKSSNEVVIQTKDFESSSAENMDIKIETLSLHLIYSQDGIFIPILRILTYNASINQTNTSRKNILKG